MKKHLVGSILILSVFLSLSSPSASQTSLQTVQQNKNLKESQTVPTNTIVNSSWEIMTAAATITVAGIVTFFANHFKVKLAKVKRDKEKKLDEVREETEQATLGSLRKHEPLKENEKRNSIVIVGIGGTGKTTLINKLFSEQAQPEIATKFYEKYYCSKTRHIHSSEIKYNFYVADYMGQNIGSLIYGMIQEQKKPYSPMTWGAINSIIFLVDVAEAPDSLGIQQSNNVSNNFWKERTKSHIKEWSPTALDAIFGLVEIKSLQYVCLFVNKFDLLQNVSEQQVKLEYKELIDAITARCRGVYFECIVGSIEKGTYLNDLDQSLLKYSYPKNG